MLTKAMTMLLLSFCLFIAGLSFSNSYAVTTCACEEPENGATWSEITEEGPCLGECNGRKEVRRRCSLSSGVVINCTLQESCINSTTCSGAWSPWAYIGNCPGPCSIQNQSRVCYKVSL